MVASCEDLADETSWTVKSCIADLQCGVCLNQINNKIFSWLVPFTRELLTLLT